MKLPPSLTTVTSLSRVFAAILFILFPFLGFFIGIRFQSNLDDAYAYQNKPAVSVDRADPTATPTPTIKSSVVPTITADTYKNWKTFTVSSNVSFKYPPTYSVKDYGNKTYTILINDTSTIDFDARSDQDYATVKASYSSYESSKETINAGKINEGLIYSYLARGDPPVYLTDGIFSYGSAKKSFKVSISGFGSYTHPTDTQTDLFNKIINSVVIK